MNNPQCPKCSGEMEEGFVFDRSHGASGSTALWIGGSPDVSSWTGNVKITDKERAAVHTYRCNKCYFLEFYAPPGAL